MDEGEEEAPGGGAAHAGLVGHLRQGHARLGPAKGAQDLERLERRMDDIAVMLGRGRARLLGAGRAGTAGDRPFGRRRRRLAKARGCRARAQGAAGTARSGWRVRIEAHGLQQVRRWLGNAGAQIGTGAPPSQPTANGTGTFLGARPGRAAEAATQPSCEGRGRVFIMRKLFAQRATPGSRAFVRHRPFPCWAVPRPRHAGAIAMPANMGGFHMVDSANRSASLSRRTLLAGIGGAGLAAAAPAIRPASAQAQVTLRWWSPQNAPAQRAAYNFQIETFQQANPGVRVLYEPTSDEGYPAQLAAAFSSGQVPNLVTHLPSFAVSNYWQRGLLEAFNDVIQAVGPQNYYEGANRIYEITQGQYAGTGIGNSAANMMWLRKDLMQQAGIASTPTTWDELRDACRRMQRGGIFGAPLPYARNSMTSLIFICFVHGAGGRIFTPDLQVDINNDAFRNALEFYRAMRELCPPGATNYSWGESLTAFVSGATATGG
ncbi:MAG: extracellular solute-binding protein, partial [Bacteroidetes bacterium]|nr:extracellular solute-binding protein [Bacteroidota bacterium]